MADEGARPMIRAVAIVMAITLSASGVAAEPILTTLLTPDAAASLGIEEVFEIAVDPEGAVVVGGRVRGGTVLFDLGGRRTLVEKLDGPLSSAVFTPDGALLAVVGAEIGFVAGGRFHPQLQAPGDSMRLAVARDRIYLHESSGAPSSLYVLQPDLGTLKLATFPRAIGAADAAGDTLFFSVANDVYRLLPGGDLRLICRIPGPAITGVAAVTDETIFFLAGRTLYRFGREGITEILSDLGDRLARRGAALYVLDLKHNVLIKMEGFDGIPIPKGDTQ